MDVDGRRIYSKKAQKRHAEPGEVMGLIREAASGKQ